MESDSGFIFTLNGSAVTEDYLITIPHAQKEAILSPDINELKSDKNRLIERIRSFLFEIMISMNSKV